MASIPDPNKFNEEDSPYNYWRGAERLAYWYLRLNGFLLLENFIIHPDEGTNQCTDIDLLGVRFSNRAENYLHPMQDDPKITNCNKLCNIIITEVKSGTCKLNGVWTDRPRKNMHRFLNAIGCFSRSEIDIAAKNLYESGCYQSGEISCRLIAIGERRGIIKPKIPQILWTEIIEFVYNRFNKYQDQKASVGNWIFDGIKLKELAKYYEKDEFEKQIRNFFYLNHKDGECM